MAFQKAVINIVRATVGTGIKISLRKGRKSQAKMAMILLPTAVTALEWGDKDKLEVLIGDGEHHGLMRLRKNNSAGEAVIERRETQKGAWFQVAFGHQPAFVDRSEASLWCQWEEVEDGWVEIVLPKWADETGQRVVARQPASSPRPVPMEPKRTTVTASLMGDPPPGRRQMLEEIDRAARKSMRASAA